MVWDHTYKVNIIILKVKIKRNIVERKCNKRSEKVELLCTLVSLLTFLENVLMLVPYQMQKNSIKRS